MKNLASRFFPRAGSRRFRRASLVAGVLAGAVLCASAGLSIAQTTTAPTQAATHAAALDSFRQARELYLQQNYAEANTANNKALQIEPTLHDAQVLRTVLQSKLSDGPTTQTTPGSNDASANVPAPKVKVLSLSQVSMIRLQELSDKDAQIRGRIPRKTLDAFWNTYLKTQPGQDLSQTAYNTFVSPNNFANQVRAIKSATDPSFAESVEITNDPADMVAFRTTVLPYVLQNCATSACHGGDKAGNFHLLRPTGGASDSVTYTNFYIMSSYAGKSGGRVINRNDPDQSLFLQYGLPKTVAHFAHPGTADVRPRFGETSQPEYQVMAAWVKSLAYPQPNYGIVYEIPGMTPAPATAPATPAPAPATRPAQPRPTTTPPRGR